MPPAQPPDHLAEVFRYLSSSTKAVMGDRRQAYGAFQSSYYTSPAARPNSSEETIKSGTASSNTVSTTSEAVEKRPNSKPEDAAQSSPGQQNGPSKASAPQRSAAVAKVVRVESKSVTQAPKAPLQFRHSIPSSQLPLQPTTPSTANKVTFSPIKQTILHALSAPETRPLPSRRRVSDLDDSVGSIELPTEQLPDSEFLSLVSRQEFASCSVGPLSAVSSPAHTVVSTGRAGELSGTGRVAYCQTWQINAVKEKTNDCSRSFTDTASFSTTRHVTTADPDVTKTARSCSIASTLEQRGSLVFLSEGSFQTFPGMRRVSLRRPVFDTDDDGNY